MASRAHGLWQWWSETGVVVPAATVYVRDPGTTDLVSDTLYANDSPDATVLPNPFTSDANGFASFFLEDARRVDLRFEKTGFTSVTIPSIDVTFPANRFTFLGAYSAVTAYEPDDVVTYNDETWIALQATTGNAPTAGANWAKMAAAGTSTPADGSVSTVKLADDAVTYAKLQNVSAASRLLGRGSASGAGNTEEITLGSGLSMSGTSLTAAGVFSGAAMSAASVHTVGAGSYTQIPWAGFAYEEADNYGTAGDDQFSIPATDIYRITFQVGFSLAATPTSGTLSLSVAANGDIATQSKITLIDSPATGGSTLRIVAGTRDVALTSGDTLAVWVREDTDTTATVDLRPDVTFFSIQRL